MVRKTPEQAERAIRRIVTALEAPVALEAQYAEALLQVALQNAAGRPTPQAQMAAQNLVADGSLIRPLAGGPPEEVGPGSEYGSSIYRQFQAPHNSAGYWLYPAGDDQRTRAAGDLMLEGVLQSAIRSV